MTDRRTFVKEKMEKMEKSSENVRPVPQPSVALRPPRIWGRIPVNLGSARFASAGAFDTAS